MVNQLIFWECLILQGVLLLRAFRGRFFGKYPLFYLYLLWVSVRSLVGFCVMLRYADFYPHFYWYTQFIDLLLGCGIIIELYRQGLVHYPGAARMARNVLGLVFAVVISKVISNAISGMGLTPGLIAYQLEGSLRIVQCVFLGVLIALFSYYAIPLGKNLRGLMLGYGFFLGTSVINLTFRTELGSAFQSWWSYLQPLSYNLVVVIWCSALWSYAPMPVPAPESRLEHDYELLAAGTRRRLAQIRNHLWKAV